MKRIYGEEGVVWSYPSKVVNQIMSQGLRSFAAVLGRGRCTGRLGGGMGEVSGEGMEDIHA